MRTPLPNHWYPQPKDVLRQGAKALSLAGHTRVVQACATLSPGCHRVLSLPQRARQVDPPWGVTFHLQPETGLKDTSLGPNLAAWGIKQCGCGYWRNALTWDGVQSIPRPRRPGRAEVTEGREPGRINITLPARAGPAQSPGCLFWGSASAMFPRVGVRSTPQAKAEHAAVVPTRRRGNVSPGGLGGRGQEFKTGHWALGSPPLMAKGSSPSRSGSAGSIFPGKLQR